MATPALVSIRKGWPDVDITLMGKQKARLLLEGLSLWDDYLTFDRHGQQSGTFNFLKVAGYLRQRQFDMGLILPNSLSAALLFTLGGVKRRVGYNRHGRRVFLTHPVPVPRNGKRFVPVPMVTYYLRLVENIGVKPILSSPVLVVDPKDAAWAADRWELIRNHHRPLVAVTPGAAYGPSKQWIPEYFARVSDMLQEQLGAHIIFLPGPGEESLMDRILKSCKMMPEILPPSETPLNRLKAVIQCCDLLLTNDTGPRHIAVALLRPVVVLMGPTDPRYTAVALEHTLILRKDLSCSPCMLKSCPRDHACMTQLTPTEVYKACEHVLLERGVSKSSCDSSVTGR